MLDKPRRGIPEAKYPWKELKVGESFPVDPNDIKLSSLRPFATRMGKKFGKKFRVKDHGESYEVGCIPMSTAEAITTSQNIVEVLNKTGSPLAAPLDGMTLIEALAKQKQENGE